MAQLLLPRRAGAPEAGAGPARGPISVRQSLAPGPPPAPAPLRGVAPSRRPPAPARRGGCGDLPLPGGKPRPLWGPRPCVGPGRQRLWLALLGWTVKCGKPGGGGVLQRGITKRFSLTESSPE